MSGTLDTVNALRLAGRELRRRSLAHLRRGDFMAGEELAEAADVVDGLRFRLDARMEEMERDGAKEMGGMKMKAAE